MKEFDEVWKDLLASLKTDTKIKNWTVYSGYLGDTMKVIVTGNETISIDAPRAKNTLVVPKEDFEAVWEVWIDYKREKVKRNELSPLTRFSKYVISIFHWYETDLKP
jgi:hypothetical protein